MTAGTRDVYRFFHRLRVRWAEVDRQGVVFNGHYLAYFDVGTTEYWRTLGLTYPEQFLSRSVDTYAVKATLEYRSPARYDDEIDVFVRTAKLGNTSLTFSLAVFREETALVTGELVYAFVDSGTQKKTPIPAAVRERITRYERTPPEETPRSS